MTILYIPLRSDKSSEYSLEAAVVTVFISHYVQIKAGVWYAYAISFDSFISHYVQIKENRGT